MLFKQLREVVAHIRRVSGQQPVRRRTERVQVRTTCRRLAAHHLGSDEVRRTEDLLPSGPGIDLLLLDLDGEP